MQLKHTNVFKQFNSNIWLLMCIEFFERLAYYGCAFSVTMYSLKMLNVSVSDSNLMMNGMYAVSPVGALIGANLADGPMSRKLILLMAATIYSAGLCLMAYSSMPSMYEAFPLEPTKTSLSLFCCSIALFGLGYGALKVVVSPLIGDCLAGQDEEENDERDPEATNALLSTLYRLDYFIFNLGSLIGILFLPMMRELDPRKKHVEGSDEVQTGFYYTFWASAAATVIGGVLCLIGFCRFKKNSTCCTSYIYLVFMRAFSTRVRFMLGKGDDEFQKAHKGKFLEYATHNMDKTTTFCREITCLIHPMRDAFKACKVLAPLPIYWLLQTQFTSNIVLQASWLDIPDWVQPEAYNNVSTLALLIFMPILETCIIPRVWPFRRPPVIPRMLIGFGLNALAIIYAGVLQVIISSRGSFTEQGDYILHEGAHKMNGMWLVGAFVLQGLAGVFVDTTSLEAAYTIAAPCMKSLVVAIYLMASACAGFTGMALSPVITANTLVYLFFTLAVLQGLVMCLFKFIAGGEIDANLSDPSEERLISEDPTNKKSPYYCGGDGDVDDRCTCHA